MYIFRVLTNDKASIDLKQKKQISVAVAYMVKDQGGRSNLPWSGPKKFQWEKQIIFKKNIAP